MLHKCRVPVGIISVIIHKTIITQTDDHQSTCDLFDSACMIQTKKGAQQDLIKVHLYFHSRELLKQSARNKNLIATIFNSFMPGGRHK